MSSSFLPLGIIVIAAGAIAVSGYYFTSDIKEKTQGIERYAQINTNIEPAAGKEIKAPVFPESPQTRVEIEEDESFIQDNIIQTSATGAQTATPTIDVQAALAPRSVGNPDAPIKMVEYASLSCGHCATFHTEIYPELKTKYIDTGKVYFTFQDFPLNRTALAGSVIARCLPAERHESFVSLLFKNQDKWAFDSNYESFLRQNAKLAGMSDAVFDACMNNEEIKSGLSTFMQLAQKQFEITSTPSFVINAKEIVRGGSSLESFETIFKKFEEKETE